jgi:hypothetical protein
MNTEKLNGTGPPNMLFSFLDPYETGLCAIDMAKVWEKCKPKMNIRKPFGVIMIFGTGGKVEIENSNFYKQMWDES